MPRFADIQGQEAVHARLRAAALRGKVPHAYLFHGTRGVGKTSTAFALAQFLNCETPEDADSCGACPSCRKIHRLRHPDLHWIFPMPGSEKGQKWKGEQRIGHLRGIMDERLGPGIHVLSHSGAASIAIGRDEDTRAGSIGEVRHEAGLLAVEARLKVFVVTQAERMTRDAANSLLKILEEPPAGNLIILTADRLGELPDTILSRCHAVRFRDLGEEGIRSLLLARAGWSSVTPRKTKNNPDPDPVWSQMAADPTAAALAAALAGGSLTRAAELAEDDVVAQRDRVLAILSLEPGDPDLHSGIRNLDEALAPGGSDNDLPDRRSVERLIDLGLLWLGDVLRVATGSGLPLANRDREADVRAQAARLGPAEIRRRASLFEEARAALRGNVSRPLVLYPLLHGLGGSPRKAGVA
jgi:DNA polymerase-3 subunit delta'